VTIAAVVLGGTSIFGGRGTIFGSVSALVLVGVVQTGMGVAGVKAEAQIAVRPPLSSPSTVGAGC